MASEKFSNEVKKEPRAVTPGLTRCEVLALLSTGVVKYKVAAYLTDDLTSDKDEDERVNFSRDGRLDAFDVHGLSGAVARYVADEDDKAAAVSHTRHQDEPASEPTPEPAPEPTSGD